MDAPTITLGKHTETLVPPSATAAFAVHPEPGRELSSVQVLCLCCAALAICWPPERKWPAPKRPRPWDVRKDVLQYGSEVYDGLVAAGYPLSEIASAAQVAQRWSVGDHLLTEEEVQAAVDFSEAPAAG